MGEEPRTTPSPSLDEIKTRCGDLLAFRARCLEKAVPLKQAKHDDGSLLPCGLGRLPVNSEESNLLKRLETLVAMPNSKEAKDFYDRVMVYFLVVDIENMAKENLCAPGSIPNARTGVLGTKALIMLENTFKPGSLFLRCVSAVRSRAKKTGDTVLENDLNQKIGPYLEAYFNGKSTIPSGTPARDAVLAKKPHLYGMAEKDRRARIEDAMNSTDFRCDAPLEKPTGGGRSV